MLKGYQIMAKKTFEDSLAQLEQIVQELESGSLPLENALKKFEDGMKLSQFCEQKLDEIQKKVTLLIQHQDGQIEEKSFLTEDNL